MKRGNTVELRAPVAADTECLSRIRNDAELQASLMAVPKPNSRKRVDEWVEGILNDPLSVFFVVASLADGQCLGFIQMRKLDLIHGTGDLGICLDRAAQGQGVGKEAIQLLESYVHETFRLRKVVLQVLVSNAGAIQCYRSCGYREVGTLQQHFYHHGQFHDTLIMERILGTP